MRGKKGTKSGDIASEKWRDTMKKKHGENWREIMREQGRKGGSVSTPTGGFGYSHERAVEAGRKAGKISKRGHTFLRTEGQYNVYIANDTGKVVKYKHGKTWNNKVRGE